MSNQGVRAFYQVTTILKDNLLEDINVNTVTSGDITKIDLNKQTIYPLSHIVINSVTHLDQVLRFNVSILLMDIVDFSKDEETDIFIGNSNQDDVHNTQHAVIEKLIMKLRGGTLYEAKYQLPQDFEVECIPFTDRFENEIAGWEATFDILVENDVNIC